MQNQEVKMTIEGNPKQLNPSRKYKLILTIPDDKKIEYKLLGMNSTLTHLNNNLYLISPGYGGITEISLYEWKNGKERKLLQKIKLPINK